jgi:hypothetical protein
MPDLESLLARLIKGRVDFIVVGGFAAIAHGVTLLTEYIDICCPFSIENLLALQAALRDLHPVHRLTPARWPLELTAESCQGLRNLYLDTDFGQLDCLSNVRGLGEYDKVKEHGVELLLEEGSCRVLSLDALIIAKEMMGRTRDKMAVQQLRAIKERLK